MALTPFHYAFPVTDLQAARQFYGGLLACNEGRSSERWIDFDLYGHQIVAHLVPEFAAAPSPTNEVDQRQVPIPHFGVVLEWQRWHELAAHLRSEGVEFRIAPTIRFAGQVGEQATMFFSDPSGNALEFKSFKDPARLFSAD